MTVSIGLLCNHDKQEILKEKLLINEYAHVMQVPRYCRNSVEPTGRNHTIGCVSGCVGAAEWTCRSPVKPSSAGDIECGNQSQGRIWLSLYGNI